MQIEELNKALATLTKEEQELMEVIFYREESLRSIGKKEILSLEKEIQDLTKNKAKVQDEFKQIDHIKYAVKIVGDEYGIDLSIEIDKAIKRGDKPSVIAQLKKFQEQEERKGQYKQKAKEKYKGEER